MDAPEGVGCAAVGQGFTQSDRWGELMHFCSLEGGCRVRTRHSDAQTSVDGYLGSRRGARGGVVGRGLEWRGEESSGTVPGRGEAIEARPRSGVAVVVL